MKKKTYVRAISLAFVIMFTMVSLGQSGSVIANLDGASDGESVTSFEGVPVSYMPMVLHGIAEPGLYGVQYYYDDMNPDKGGKPNGGIGAMWARYYFGWGVVEPEYSSPRQYDWERFDEQVEYAEVAGLELIFNINRPPDWAQDPATGRIAVEHHDEFATFMAALVERYDGDGYADAPGKPVVTYFEIINEPDHAYLGYYDVGDHYGYVPEEYAALMKTVYPAIKSANPNAQVVMGGVAMDWFVEEDANGNGKFTRDFVEDLFRECQGYNCFDVVNFHAYPEFENRWIQYGKALYGKGIYIRSLMSSYGIGNLPLMVTETRWGGNNTYGGDQAQCRFIIKLFTRGLALDLESLIWFKSDDNNAPLKPGLLDTEFERKASSYTLELVINRLIGADFQRVLTVADTGHTDIEGYRFVNAHNTKTDVLWVQDDLYADFSNEPSYQVRLYASQVTVYTWDLNQTVIKDADDGSNDGRVTLTVDCDPIIVEYN